MSAALCGALVGVLTMRAVLHWIDERENRRHAAALVAEWERAQADLGRLRETYAQVRLEILRERGVDA